MSSENNIIQFPRVKEFPPTPPHKLFREGDAMVIKHTHPEHADEESRVQKILETRQICLAMLKLRRQQEPRKRGA